MTLAPDVVHIFPEWGFMMPFGFLTGNKRPYIIDASNESIERLAKSKKSIRLVYWSQADNEKYVALLEKNGFTTIDVQIYFQRDRIPAFSMIRATAN